MVTAKKGTKHSTGRKGRETLGQREQGQWGRVRSESESLRSRLAKTRSSHRIGKCLQWSETELEWRIRKAE